MVRFSFSHVPRTLRKWVTVHALHRLLRRTFSGASLLWFSRSRRAHSRRPTFAEAKLRCHWFQSRAHYVVSLHRLLSGAQELSSLRLVHASAHRHITSSTSSACTGLFPGTSNCCPPASCAGYSGVRCEHESGLRWFQSRAHAVAMRLHLGLSRAHRDGAGCDRVAPAIPSMLRPCCTGHSSTQW